MLSIPFSSSLSYTPTHAVVVINDIYYNSLINTSYSAKCGNGLIFQNEYVKIELLSISNTSVKLNVSAISTNATYKVIIKDATSVSIYVFKL